MNRVPIDQSVDQIFDDQKFWTTVNYPSSELQKKWDKISKYIEKIWEPARQYRKQYDKNWERYYEFYKGKQWPTYKRSWQACLTINQTLRTIESIVAIMTDHKPKINLLPSDPSQEVYVETLAALIDTIWRKRNVLFTIQDALRASLIYGVGYCKVFWNPDLEGGVGDVDASSPSVWDIWVEPGCKDFKDSSFVIHGEWVPISHIKQNYPRYAKYVRPGMGAPKDRARKKGANPYSESNDGPSMISPVAGSSEIVVDGTTNRKQTGEGQGSWDTEEVYLVEAWFVDDETYTQREWVTAIDPFDKTVSLVEQVTEHPKYPHGRVVTKVGNVILRDIPAPYQLYEWPFILFKDNPDPEEGFYGFGEVELLEDLQKELNKRRSQITDHANLMGNGVWIVDHNSRVNTDKLTNKPGLVIEKMPGSEVRREPPPPLPEYLFRSAEKIVADMDDITGVNAVLGGLVPKGIRSGAGLSEAQDIAATRVRLKVKQMERAIGDIGRLMIKLIQQYYTKPRVISILGARGDVQWVEFDGRTIRGDWDIIIGTGSTLPVSKVLRFEQAVRLYQLGAIDRRALLQSSDFPGAEEILRRMGDDAGSGGDQIPARDISGPPPKTDNSRSRRTGRSMLADVQIASDAQPGPSDSFGHTPS